MAVRLSLTDPDREVDIAGAGAARRARCPTASCPSSSPRDAPPATRGSRPSGRRAAGALTLAVAERVAAVGGRRRARRRSSPAEVTGRTAAGWSARWCDRAHVVPPEVRERWAAEMEVLDGGLPTGWCHGDLWPGNVLLDGDVTTVIDWDNASDDAPLGLDALLVHALARDRRLRRPRERVAAPAGRRPAAAREHARSAAAPWATWARARAPRAGASRRRALPAQPLPARPRPGAPRPAPRRRSSRRPPAAPEPAQPSAEAARTARGALWLATNGIVVKTSQTVVLLALAAMLAPSALGVVALGTLVANVSAVVTSLGTASALVYWRGDVLRAARTAVTVGVAHGRRHRRRALDRRALAGVGLPRRGRRRRRDPRTHRDPAVPGRRRGDQRAAAPAARVRPPDHPRHHLVRRRRRRGDRRW